MKLFKIELSDVGYDDYDSCIIVAESKEQVEELCRCNFVEYEDWDTEHHCPKVLYDRRNVLSESFDIHNGQKWTITEVDINEIKQPTIICSNFVRGEIMKIKVYSPNGKELLIHAKKLNECPLCHKLGFITNSTKDEEGVDLFCSNCNLEFTSFSLRNFIKLRGFIE